MIKSSDTCECVYMIEAFDIESCGCVYSHIDASIISSDRPIYMIKSFVTCECVYMIEAFDIKS